MLIRNTLVYLSTMGLCQSPLGQPEAVCVSDKVLHQCLPDRTVSSRVIICIGFNACSLLRFIRHFLYHTKSYGDTLHISFLFSRLRLILGSTASAIAVRQLEWLSNPDSARIFVPCFFVSTVHWRTTNALSNHSFRQAATTAFSNLHQHNEI